MLSKCSQLEIFIMCFTAVQAGITLISYIDYSGPVRQPYAIVDFIPQPGTQNLATDQSPNFGIFSPNLNRVEL